MSAAIAGDTAAPRLSQPAQEMLLRVDGIHTYYGKSHILDGVSLDIGRGEVVGLLGRNGVGKSTTLKAIAGVVPPSRPAGARFLSRGARSPACRRIAWPGWASPTFPRIAAFFRC